jgi:hypothetical protein
VVKWRSNASGDGAAHQAGVPAHQYLYETRASIECPEHLEKQGTIVVDRADHYRGTIGTITMDGNHSMDDSVALESTRYAACTGPQD